MSTPTKTNEQVLEDARAYALRQYSYAAQTLRSELAGAKRDIDHAIVAMETGNRPGGSISGGPLGHQRPFDITRAAASVEAARNFAVSIGCTREQLDEAYAAGVKAGA